MGQTQDSSRPSGPCLQLEQLPLEAKQAILSSLTDIASLKATTLTCSSLLHAFKNAEELIATDVLLNEIDVEVLPEAIIANRSERWRMSPTFADEHLQSRQPISSKKRFKTSETIPLSRAAKCVNFFAADFAAKARAAWPQFGDSTSREEMNRIQRAFYRFETYRNICTSPIPPCRLFQRQVRDMPAAIFFGCFSPWENEQLACIYDYLFSVIAPIFNDIVEHDVAWAEYFVNYAEDCDSGHIQYLLSLGLPSFMKS